MKNLVKLFFAFVVVVVAFSSCAEEYDGILYSFDGGTYQDTIVTREYVNGELISSKKEIKSFPTKKSFIYAEHKSNELGATVERYHFVYHDNDTVSRQFTHTEFTRGGKPFFRYGI